MTSPSIYRRRELPYTTINGVDPLDFFSTVGTDKELPRWAAMDAGRFCIGGFYFAEITHYSPEASLMFANTIMALMNFFHSSAALFVRRCFYLQLPCLATPCS